MKHDPTIRSEFREGMRRAEYRILCPCGWEEKALTHNEAQFRAHAHMVRRGQRITPTWHTAM